MRPLRSRLIYYEIWPQLGKWAKSYRIHIDQHLANFIFQLSDEEVEDMVSQNAIPSKQSLGGTLPYAFTEHGILMLSNVLKNERAIQMSIRIIEIFVRLREMLNLYKDVAILIEQIENKLGKQDQKIELLFSYLNQFIQKEEGPRVPIGFKQKI